MAASNYTTGEEWLVECFCSANSTGEIHSYFTFLSVLNMFLSITAILGNILILVALHKESSLHPPSKLFFRCLATSDLCVGLISEPLSITYWMSVVNQRWNICRYARIASYIAGHLLCSVSLFTLTAMSVDRLLALLLLLNYRQVVTLKRTFAIVIILWIVSTVGATMTLWNPVITSWYGYIGIPLCLVTSTCCYTKIFLRLGNYQTQVQGRVNVEQPSVQDGIQQVQRGRTIPLNIARYKKAVYSALWLQLTLVACYLPYGITDAFSNQRRLSRSAFLAGHFTSTLVFLNSSLNPIIYCWKMRDVRLAVKDTIRTFFGLSG